MLDLSEAIQKTKKKKKKKKKPTQKAPKLRAKRYAHPHTASNECAWTL